jgi:XkdW protein
MKMPEAIKHIYPELRVNIDFGVGDLSDGNGAFIEFWNTDKPKPTQSQLDAAWEEIKDIPEVQPKSIEEILEEKDAQIRRLEAQNEINNENFLGLVQMLEETGVLS